MSSADRLSIIRQLSRLNHRLAGDNVLICCPSPEHNDSTPSCSVYIGRPSQRRPLGYAYCWGCGWQGNWTNLCTLLNMKELSGDIEVEKISKYTKDQLLPSNVTLKSLMRDMNCKGKNPIEVRTWRGISRDILKAMGCFYSDFSKPDSDFTSRVLFMPCKVEGNYVGAIKASLKKIEGRNSYFNSPGKWSLTMGYFGYDYSHQHFAKDMPVILVEGPRDALSLIQLGYPAVSILGSKSFGKEKAMLLLKMKRKIFIFMDGDKAGVSATNLVANVYKELLGDNFKSKVSAYLPIKRAMLLKGITKEDASKLAIDPASMSKEFEEDFIKSYNRFMKR